MPFKSKAQQRLFFAKEERGELPKGKARQWAHETPDIKQLPEHVKKSSVIGDTVLQKVAAVGLQKTAAQGAYWRFKGASASPLQKLKGVVGAVGKLNEQGKAISNAKAALSPEDLAYLRRKLFNAAEESILWSPLQRALKGQV